MAYNLTGPLNIGTTGQLNNILGNLRVTDITTTQGNLLAVGVTGNLTAVATGTSGQVLTSNGAGTQPTFQSVILADESVSATKTAGFSFTNVPAVVPIWSVAGTGRYNTGSLSLASGIITVANTGKFDISSTINFTNVSNAGSRTLELVADPGGLNTVLSTVTIQPTPDIALDNTINLSTSLALTAATTIGFRFYGSVAAGGSVLPTSELQFARFA